MDIQLDFKAIDQALDRTLGSDTFRRGDSIRLLHGRGQTLPGFNWLNIDWFAPVILITQFQQDHRLERLVDYLLEKFSFLNIHVSCIIKQERFVSGALAEVLYGDLPRRVLASRQGLNFALSFEQQNVGYFLDMDPARDWLQAHCQSKRILNLFAYTCAFSVVAMAAGATSIVNIDLSRRSLNTGRDNHNINNLNTENAYFFAHDIFKSWGKLKKYGPYDIVIVDPPSFQKGSFIANKDYGKVLQRMASLVEKQGYVVACLNSPEVALDEFASSCSSILHEFKLQSALPTSEFFPEKEAGRGLKVLVYQKL